MSEIRIPTLGESINTATLSKLHKTLGDFVKKNEIIAEIETDKITLEITSTSNGKITQILHKIGDTIQINSILAIVDDKIQCDIKPNLTQQVDQITLSNNNYASPAAQVLLDSYGIDNLSNGTGKNGRITKNDALNAINQLDVCKRNICNDDSNTIQNNCNTIIASTSALNTFNKDTLNEIISKDEQCMHQNTIKQSINNDDVNKLNHHNCTSNIHNMQNETRIKMTKIRETISKRLKDVQNTAAILTTFNEIDMFEVVNLRNQYKEEFQKKYGIKLGLMSFFVKAVVIALQEFDMINASIDGNEIVYKHYYNIGVAVGTDSGLVVPVLLNADRLSFNEIESQIHNFGQKAQKKQLTIQDMSNGTFTITNGGVYGSLLSTPILNPPQSAILGMHNIVQRPIGLKNGEIALRPMMYIALSYDHRLIDGKDAVQFLIKVKCLIEQPLRLLLLL